VIGLLKMAVSQDTRRARMPTFFARKNAACSPIFSRGAFSFWKRIKLMRFGIHRRIDTASALGVIVTSAAAAAFLFLPSAARCAQSTPPPAQSPVTQSAGENAKPAAPLIVKDEAGRTVEIPQPVKRIISLAPSVTETIYALGAQDRLIADSDACDYPPAAQKLPKIGGPFTPNLEVIVSMKPDLVIAAANSGNRKEAVDALDLLHVPTYATNAATVDEVLASIVKLSDVLGAGEQGRALSESLRARLQDLHHKLENATPARVFFVVWHEPLMSVGQNTYIADAMRRAGAESVIPIKEGYPRVSWEEVVRAQPEYLVFGSMHPEEIAGMMTTLRNLPGWRDLKAVSENKIVIISDGINVPAPRIVDAIEELARHLHPEAFIDAPHAPERGALLVPAIYAPSIHTTRSAQ
jgi:iron complex transport system substrate-binding protein